MELGQAPEQQRRVDQIGREKVVEVASECRIELHVCCDVFERVWCCQAGGLECWRLQRTSCGALSPEEGGASRRWARADVAEFGRRSGPVGRRLGTGDASSRFRPAQVQTHKQAQPHK